MFSKLWSALFRGLLRGTLLFLLFLGMAMAGSFDSSPKKVSKPRPNTKETQENSLSLEGYIPTRVETDDRAETDRKIIAEKMIAPPKIQSKKMTSTYCRDNRGIVFQEGDPGFGNCVDEERLESREVPGYLPPNRLDASGVGIQIRVPQDDH